MDGKRGKRGRPRIRWQDDITEKKGTTWIRKATDRRQWKTLMESYTSGWTMEDTDGELHPAVDGQSQGER